LVGLHVDEKMDWYFVGGGRLPTVVLSPVCLIFRIHKFVLVTRGTRKHIDNSGHSPAFETENFCDSFEICIVCQQLHPSLSSHLSPFVLVVGSTASPPEHSSAGSASNWSKRTATSIVTKTDSTSIQTKKTIATKTLNRRENMQQEQQPPPPSDTTDTCGEQEGAGAGDTQQAMASTTAALRKSALQDNIERKGKNAYYFAHAHKSSGPQWDGKEQPKLLSKTPVVSAENDSHAGTLHRSSSVSTFDYAKSNITTYAFIDEPNKVKIYIENLQGVGLQCTDDDIALDYTPTSLSLVIQNYRTPGTTIPAAAAPINASTTSASETEGEKDATAAAVASDAPTTTNTATTTTMTTTTTATTTTTTTWPPKCLAFSKLTGRITKAVYKKKQDRIILILTKEEEGEWRTINCKGDGAGGSSSNKKNAHHHHHHHQDDDRVCHETVV
jgi:hypothetical protein